MADDFPFSISYISDDEQEVSSAATNAAELLTVALRAIVRLLALAAFFGWNSDRLLGGLNPAGLAFFDGRELTDKRPAQVDVARTRG
jgi:hypothetical protein